MRLLNFLQKSDNSVGIIVGRFNPPHNGHIKLIDKACEENEAVYVCIVEGEKSSLDAERNPIPANYILELLKPLLPSNCIAQVCQTGFIPTIFANTRYELINKNITIYCGPDRYKKFSDMKKYMEEDFRSSVHVKMENFNRNGISSTIIRNLLRKKDLQVQDLLPYSADKLYRWF